MADEENIQFLIGMTGGRLFREQIEIVLRECGGNTELAASRVLSMLEGGEAPPAPTTYTPPNNYGGQQSPGKKISALEERQMRNPRCIKKDLMSLKENFVTDEGRKDMESFEKQKRFSRKDIHIPCGFLNVGLNCYVNAVLQVLYATPSFRELLLTHIVPNVEDITSRDLTENEETQLKSMNCLQQIITEQQMSSKTVVDVSPFLVSIGARREQGDVQEAFMVVLDIIEQAYHVIDDKVAIKKLHDLKDMKIDIWQKSLLKSSLPASDGSIPHEEGESHELTTPDHKIKTKATRTDAINTLFVLPKFRDLYTALCRLCGVYDSVVKWWEESTDVAVAAATAAATAATTTSGSDNDEGSSLPKKKEEEEEDQAFLIPI
ncbi:hypothetical protein ADUPG1_000472 [Aduncisulcus paluster]|uniref:USP domain-containing protein n=1 Tax=Aduncisulcus paluster TaxID=2918883 RepID=A0ABQ5KAF6_9EUKA|nr:hypothetical protein ADUPG1_000472 [Aduncisulcus paluster]